MADHFSSEVPQVRNQPGATARAAELTVEHATGPYRFVEIDGAGHFLTDDLGAPTVERELIAHVSR